VFIIERSNTDFSEVPKLTFHVEKNLWQGQKMKIMNSLKKKVLGLAI
jgi:hypothetical protein